MAYVIKFVIFMVFLLKKKEKKKKKKEKKKKAVCTFTLIFGCGSGTYP